jgi:hypothetical protein
MLVADVEELEPSRATATCTRNLPLDERACEMTDASLPEIGRAFGGKSRRPPAGPFHLARLSYRHREILPVTYIALTVNCEPTRGHSHRTQYPTRIAPEGVGREWENSV